MTCLPSDKSDNIMLEGCREGKKWMNDDAMWGNKPIADKTRFWAVLADFGFAWATSAADYEQTEEEGHHWHDPIVYIQNEATLI